MDVHKGTLGLVESVHELGELDLDEGDVEFEVDLGGSDGEGAAGIVEGGFDGGWVLVLFAF